MQKHTYIIISSRSSLSLFLSDLTHMDIRFSLSSSRRVLGVCLTRSWEFYTHTYKHTHTDAETRKNDITISLDPDMLASSCVLPLFVLRLYVFGASNNSYLS